MNRIAGVLLIFSMAVWAAGLGAEVQAAKPDRLTLEECLALALEHNPEVQIARQALEAARGRSLQSAALPNPELVAEAEGLPLNENGGEKEVSVGIQGFFEFPGKRTLRKTMSRYEEEAAAMDVERIRAVVKARVKSAYYRAAAGRQRLALLKSALDDLKSYSALAQARYAALQTSSVDVSRGMIEELKVRVEVVDARRAFQADLASLYLTMGVQPAEALPVLDGLTYETQAGAPAAVLERIGDRASLKADGLRQSRAEAGAELARKSSLPDFTLGLFYPSLRTSGWGISVQTTLPLFGAKRRGEVLEAEAELRRAEVSRRARRTRVESAVSAAVSELALLREKLELYDASLLRETERLIQSALRDYQYGKLDSLGLLDFYRTWRDVNLEYLNTLLRHAQASAELEVAGEDDLVEE